MLKVVRKLLCFGGPKPNGRHTPTKVKQKPINEYACDMCELRFLTKSLYKCHQKIHYSSTKSPIDVPKEPKSSEKTQNEQKIKNPVTSAGNEILHERNSQVKGSISYDHTTDFLGVSQKSPKVQVYFKNTKTNPPRLSKLVVEDSKINDVVAKVKAKSIKQRRESELKFINAYRKGQSHITYGIAEEWIERYEDFLNGHCKELPGSIDNLPLKERLKYKSVPQNTYAVNELIWRFLQKLYGGGPEVIIREKSEARRQSIIDKFSDTNDTLAGSIRSDALDSLRDSIIDLEQSLKPDLENSGEPVGMPNPGFYCYMNSCLQSLLGINELVEYILQGKYRELIDPARAKFWPGMSEVITASFSKKPYYIPEPIKKLAINNFDPTEQHDAHEFLNFIMSGMQDEVNLSQPKNTIEHKSSGLAWSYYKKYHISMIDELFAGQLASKVTCVRCRNVTTKYDPFLDISLPVIAEDITTLDECLAAFQSEGEVIDSYKCEKCKSQQPAIKKMHIDIFPKVLIIQLKRFQTFPKKEKIMTHVEFPIVKWEINPAEDSKRQPHNYSLKAAISHFGPIDSGHYVCFSKRGNDWFLCDDEYVSKVSEEDVFTGEAYLLIYEKN